MHPKGTRQLRKNRFSGENQIYLVTTVVAQRRPIFSDFLLGRMLVNVLRYEETLRELDSLAFVVMPDHLHWLVKLRATGDLSRSIGRVKAISGRKANHMSGQTGKFWQSGFHDHALRSEESLEGFAWYVVANPVRAGLVGSVRDYPHWDAVWV